MSHAICNSAISKYGRVHLGAEGGGRKSRRPARLTASFAVIAAITVIASGYVIPSDVNVMDVVADVMFTAILDDAYAAYGELNLNATSSITDGGSLNLDSNPASNHLIRVGRPHLRCRTDTAGNPTAQASRTVIVQPAPDTTPPVILNATSSITDGGSLKLNGVQGIATFESGGHTYAAVTAYLDDGVQILNVTDPSSITAAGSIGDRGSRELDGAWGITIFESGGRTYAAVTGTRDDGVQILDVTNPSSITAAGSIGDRSSRELDGAREIATFESGGRTYAAVAAYRDDGVQILNVTDPSSITAAGSITDDDSLELDGAQGIAIFESGGRTYAAVAGYTDDGVQILDVTDPSSITAAGSITDGGSIELDGAASITIFESGGRTYAAVAGELDGSVQILDVTDPSSITAAGSITDGGSLELRGAASIATFESGGHTYAAVAAKLDDGVQILGVTNPFSITAEGSITDGGSLNLDSPRAITSFESGGHTYVAAAAYADDGVQIMRVDIMSDTMLSGLQRYAFAQVSDSMPPAVQAGDDQPSGRATLSRSQALPRIPTATR